MGEAGFPTRGEHGKFDRHRGRLSVKLKTRCSRGCPGGRGHGTLLTSSVVIIVIDYSINIHNWYAHSTTSYHVIDPTLT